MTSHDLVSGAEFQRAANLPVSRFSKLVKAGLIQPKGRIGRATVYSRGDLVKLPQILAEAGR